MMEPEIGLLMCSLVGLKPNSSCFDPFCGSGALLAYASIHGANITIGMDAAMDRDYCQRVTENFCHYGLDPPSSMLLGNVEDLVQATSDNCNATLFPLSFDFVITDPPYGMSEGIVTGISTYRFHNVSLMEKLGNITVRSALGSQHREMSSHHMSDVTLQICVKYLKPGGRAIFIVPKVSSNMETINGQGSEDDGNGLLAYYSRQGCPITHLPQGNTFCLRGNAFKFLIMDVNTLGLELRLAVRQDFSSTFSRWFVVVEKLTKSDI